jgi:hypothetical protein
MRGDFAIIGYLVDTRAWVATICTGPWGTDAAFMQRPTLPLDRVGAPPTVTRVSATVHWTVTQGLGAPPGSRNGHPAITNVSAARSTVAPAEARGLDETPVTVPPCGHINVLATVIA